MTLTPTQSLAGLAIKAISTTSSNDIDAEIPDLSIWIDNVAQCSECTSTMIGFATTIVNKTYLVSASSVTTEAFATNTNLLVNCQTFTFEYKKNGTFLG